MINLALTLFMNSMPNEVPDELIDPTFTPLTLSANLKAGLEKLIGTDESVNRLARARYALARLHAVPEVDRLVRQLDSRIAYLPLQENAVRVADPVPAFVRWMQTVHPIDIIAKLPAAGKRLYLLGQTNVETQAGAVLALLLALHSAHGSRT